MQKVTEQTEDKTNVPLLHIKTWDPEFLYTNLMCVIAYAVKRKYRHNIIII